MEVIAGGRISQIDRPAIFAVMPEENCYLLNHNYNAPFVGTITPSAIALKLTDWIDHPAPKVLNPRLGNSTTPPDFVKVSRHR